MYVRLSCAQKRLEHRGEFLSVRKERRMRGAAHLNVSRIRQRLC
jgi:hypothetical protein